MQDPAQYLFSNLSLRALKAYQDPEKYGTITGDAFLSVEEKKNGIEMKDGSLDFSGKKAVEGKKVCCLSRGRWIILYRLYYQSDTRKAEPPERREESVDPPKDASKSKPMESTTSAGPSLKPPRNSGNSSRPIKAKRRVIASSDEEEQTETEQAVAEPSSSMVRAEEKAAMEAMMGMDIEMEGDDRELEDREKRVKVETEPGARKRRPVKKSRTEEDAKGYMGRFDPLGDSVQDD